MGFAGRPAISREKKKNDAKKNPPVSPFEGSWQCDHIWRNFSSFGEILEIESN
jgi:hypothetical protein